MLSKWALISAVGIGQCVTAPTNQRAWLPTGVLGKLTVAVCAILADRPCATAVPLAVVPAITETRTAASVARHARCPRWCRDHTFKGQRSGWLKNIRGRTNMAALPTSARPPTSGQEDRPVNHNT